jgi:ABC-type lipoprotein release transport system permease subunit
MYFSLSEAKKILAGDSEITFALPRLLVAGLARSSRESAATMILGIDFAIEAESNPLLGAKRLLHGELPLNDPGKAFIGYKLAERLQLKTGNKFVTMFQDFSGEINSKLFRVGGIFKSGVSQIDNNTVFGDRRSLAEGLGNADAVHELALLITDIDRITPLQQKLQNRCPTNAGFKVFRWEETSKQLADTIKIDHAQFKFMVFLLFVLVTIGTVNLLLMSILERSREFGLLQAIGLQKKKIRLLVAAEALVLGLLGSAVGLTAGSVASYYSWRYGIDMSALFKEQEVAGLLFEPIIVSSWSWGWMIGLSFAMVVLVLAASIYPARKALEVNPADAMRSY